MSGGFRKFQQYRFFGAFRLLLAGMVMFQHFVSNAAPMAATSFFLKYEVGSLAVLVFFCLSGFVILESADILYQDRAGAFMSNRLMRVFPHFLITVTLSIGLQWIAMQTNGLHIERIGEQPTPSFSLPNILLNYISILPASDRFASYQFVGIAWAVRIEMVFYLVVAFCLLVAHRLQISFALLVLIAVAALAPLFAMTQIPTFSFLPYFIFGGALYYARKGSRTGYLMLGAAALGMVWEFASQPTTHPSLGFARDATMQAYILCALILAFVALSCVRTERFSRADAVIGSVTYPLYMYHWPVLIVITSLFADFTYGAFVAGLTTSVALAMLMARLIDPCVDRYRDRIRGWVAPG